LFMCLRSDQSVNRVSLSSIDFSKIHMVFKYHSAQQ
jgi:hypothetical protein